MDQLNGSRWPTFSIRSCLFWYDFKVWDFE